METPASTTGSLSTPLSLLDARPPRPSLWHLFGWLSFFGSFLLISFAPLFPPLFRFLTRRRARPWTGTSDNPSPVISGCDGSINKSKIWP